MKTISLDMIVSENNRKYTKDESFEQLVRSISQYGILEPPIVRAMQGGHYKTIAGRRRIAAARQAGRTEVDCVVRERGDPVDDDEIALTENVNRLDMHPLDEAAAFRRMADEGKPVEEIARYFARSPSAIYKRLRLVPLIEELKGWFRDEILGISGAALLAELPEEDQKKFYDLYKERYSGLSPEKIADGEKYSEIDNASIFQFIYKHQGNKIRECLGNDCQACKKRTHNSENDLFEEFADMDDVCLDGDCYRQKWKWVIEDALAESYSLNLPTDAKIIFRSTILEMLYKRATHAEFFYADNNTRFEILKEKDYEITGETKRKTGCCWLIHTAVDGETTAERIGYKERKKEENAASSGSSSGKNKIEQYDREVLEAVTNERGTSDTELVKALKDKHVNQCDITDETKSLVYERVIARRIEAEKSGAEPPKDYFSMFLRLADDEVYSNESGLLEKNFSDRQKQWLHDLTGRTSIKKISLGLSDETQMIFHFLLLSVGFESDVPELDDLKDIEKSGNLFWEYAGMDEEEYRALYIQAAKEVIARELEPKPKKAGKKVKEVKNG